MAKRYKRHKHLFKINSQVDGVNIIGGHLKEFQNSSRRLFFGRNEPLYAKKEKEAV